MVNLEKKCSPIFIIHLGLWIACIIHNVLYTVLYSHNSGCCWRSVAPGVTVLSRHTVCTIGMIYKFAMVWYYVKQGTTHRPTSHLAHLPTVPLFWPGDEHRWQRRWVDDLASLCWLWWLLSHTTFVVAVLSLPIKLGGRTILAFSSFFSQIPHQKQYV
jgi:hypothetical protein